MHVVIWPADQWGCGHYRLLFPAWALQVQGADVEIDWAGPKVIWSHKWPGAPEAEPPHTVSVVGLAEYPKADVVVMQRPARRWWSDVIPLLTRHGIKVVVDVDDRYDRLHPANISQFDPAKPHLGPEWVDRAVRDADVVTCTTPSLASRYGPGKSVVLPNLVPAQYLAIRTEQHRVPKSVGWPGLVGFHPEDLEATKGGIIDALEGTDWHFRVPDKTGVGRGLCPPKANLRPGMLVERGKVHFWEWMRLVAELEIGVVPLADSVFNRAKSALKACELASVGAAVVMSPTPDNARLHALGVGELATSRGQWAKRVRALIDSPDYRADLGGRSREVMATQTYEQHCERWLDAWTGKASALAA